MIGLLITLLVYLAVLGILWWAISSIPIPAPFNIIARVVIAIVAIFMLLSLASGAGYGGPLFSHR